MSTAIFGSTDESDASFNDSMAGTQALNQKGNHGGNIFGHKHKLSSFSDRQQLRIEEPFNHPIFRRPTRAVECLLPDA